MQRRILTWRGLLQGGITVFQGKLWVLGGLEDYYFGSSANLKNDVWCSEDGITWRCVTEDAPWAPRGYHRAVTLGNTPPCGPLGGSAVVQIRL